MKNSQVISRPTNKTVRLGVNIDHIATVRNARGVSYPDPVEAGMVAQQAGADGITLHLREDRRHIRDEDVLRLRDKLSVPMNFECAATDEMLAFALRVQPASCCLVPERREELTTEGGLNVVARLEDYRAICKQLSVARIQVSLFIDPDAAQIDAAVASGAPMVELHTGEYAHATHPDDIAAGLTRLQRMAAYAAEQGLVVNAGHGLHYKNVVPVAQIPCMHELNIGHAIVARALMVGLSAAVQEMKRLVVSDPSGTSMVDDTTVAVSSAT